MRLFVRLFSLALFIGLFTCSCHKGNKTVKSEDGLLMLDSASFRAALQKAIGAKDSVSQVFFNQIYTPKSYFTFWFSDLRSYSDKINALNDSILSVEKHAINPDFFRIDSVIDLVHQVDTNHIAYKILADIELKLTKSFYDYAAGMKFGFFDPAKLYPSDYFIAIQRPDSAFTSRIFSNSDSLSFYLNDVQPKAKDYKLLRTELQRMKSLKDSTFHKIPFTVNKQTIKYGKKSSSIPLIARRLMITGELPYHAGYDTAYTKFNDKFLAAINQFRKKYNLLQDKEIGNQTIEALNRDFETQYWIVATNMERLRWIPKKAISDKYVHVNVANMTLQALRGDTLEQMMKVCVGIPPDHKTPMLYGKMYEVIMNPTWTVPNSIILNEISKRMLRDPGYLSRNNMKVYKNRTPVSAYSVPWAKLSEKFQPYVVVQDSGATNSLGRLKFNFSNPFNVYLHDTNNKGAFSLHNRAVSHGCVRVEKPLSLAYFCLSDIDTTNIKQVRNKSLLQDRIRYSIGLKPQTEIGKDSIYYGRKNKKLQRVELKPGVTVLLDYLTCFKGKDGTVEFCNDHYKMDSTLIANLKRLK